MLDSRRRLHGCLGGEPLVDSTHCLLTLEYFFLRILVILSSTRENCNYVGRIILFQVYDSVERIGLRSLMFHTR